MGILSRLTPEILGIIGGAGVGLYGAEDEDNLPARVAGGMLMGGATGHAAKRIARGLLAKLPVHPSHINRRVVQLREAGGATPQAARQMPKGNLMKDIQEIAEMKKGVDRHRALKNDLRRLAGRLGELGKGAVGLGATVGAIGGVAGLGMHGAHLDEMDKEARPVLRAMGYSDGELGVLAFQREHKLKQTGFIDRDTFLKLAEKQDELRREFEVERLLSQDDAPDAPSLKPDDLPWVDQLP